MVKVGINGFGRIGRNFLRAALGLPEFDGRAEFATWLHRIALNCANSFLVCRARRATASLEEAPEPVASGVERPDRQAAGAEADARIRQALERRPEISYELLDEGGLFGVP